MTFEIGVTAFHGDIECIVLVMTSEIGVTASYSLFLGISVGLIWWNFCFWIQGEGDHNAKLGITILGKTQTRWFTIRTEILMIISFLEIDILS